MKVKEIQEILNAEILVGEDQLDQVILSACSSDMMSDVLAFSKNQSALLTGLCNPQVIRTIEMMDMECVIFVRGKTPNETVLDMAKERGIVAMVTEHPMFTASGLLYSKGISGGTKNE